MNTPDPRRHWRSLDRLLDDEEALVSSLEPLLGLLRHRDISPALQDVVLVGLQGLRQLRRQRESVEREAGL